MAVGPDVVEVPVEQIYELRRRVLRRNAPDADVRFPQDDVPGTFHLAVVDAAAVVAAATFAPTGGADAMWQLRGMAVHEAMQRTGIGKAVLEAGVARVRAGGARLLWANVRDTAAGFYERMGWTIVGGGFVTDDVAHHVGLLLV